MALYTHRMDQKRQDSAQWLSAILCSLDNAVMAVDTQGGIAVMNPRAEGLTGWPQAKALGRHVLEVFEVRHEATEALAAHAIMKVLQEGLTIDLAEHRGVLVAKDGTERPIDGSAAPITDDHGTIIGAVLVFRDITEPRRLQEQLVQAQKMEAIGRLAGRVAHDFNNLLTVIAIYTELLLRNRHRHDLLEHYTTEIKKALDAATDLTSQLLTLSCKQLPQPRVLALNGLLAKMTDVVRCLLGPAIELILVPRATMGYVNVDPAQLERVVRALVMNAHDAMSQGGTLTIETTDIEEDEQPARRYGGAQPGPYVRLTVSDTGCGMDTTTRARLFEPFFTTKSGEPGTGLSLSIVYGIVTQSGGHIEVDSAPGRGAVFSVYLPRVK